MGQALARLEICTEFFEANLMSHIGALKYQNHQFSVFKAIPPGLKLRCFADTSMRGAVQVMPR
jgi:hypothetical protein